MLSSLLSVVLVPAVYHLLVFGLLAATTGLALRAYRESEAVEARALLFATAAGTALHLALGLVEAVSGNVAGPFSRSPLIETLEATGWLVLAGAFFAGHLSRPRQAGLAAAVAVLAIGSGALLPLVLQPAGVTWLYRFWPGVAAIALLVPVAGRLRRGTRALAAGEAATLAALAGLALGQAALAAGAMVLGRWLIAAALVLLVWATDQRLSADRHAMDEELQTVSREAARQSVSQLFLVEAMRALVSSLDLETVLRNTLESVALAVDADRAVILLLDARAPNTLEVTARYDPVHREIAGLARPQVALDTQPTLAHALRRGQALVLGDQEDASRRQLAAVLGAADVGPVVVEPLLLRGKPLGVLVVSHARGKAGFTPDQVDFLQALGGQVAAALENARLYEELDRHAGELSALLRAREADVTQRQAILESIADGVVVCDASANVLLVNAAAEAVLGARRATLVGRSFDDAVRALANAREVAVRNLMALASDRPFKFETEIDGGTRVLQGSLSVVRTADDIAPLGTVVVLRDVTRERQAERAKAAFITTVSHELRTPLTAIKGYLHFLVTGAAGPLAPMQHQFVQTIQENSDRMVRLINNMILVYEMEGGSIQLHYAMVEPGPLLAKTVADAAPQAAECSVQLLYRQAGDLPPIEADPNQLRTIVEQLLSNALKYTAAGGRVTVTAKCEALPAAGDAPSYLAVEVRDTGTGIPPEQQAHLFERFSAHDDRPQTVRAGGMGVGLSIVRSLVDAHGGRIWVQSKVGEGSAFTFVIPSGRVRREAAP